jgi:hypothetical protein
MNNADFIFPLSRRVLFAVVFARFLLQFYYHRSERVFRNEDGLFFALLRRRRREG